MQVKAKVTPADQPVSNGQILEVTDRIAVAPGDNIALDISSDAVGGYVREGSDLVLQMKSGESLRIANFYAAQNNPAQLFLVDGQELLLVDLPVNPVEGALTASYVPRGVAAQFAGAAEVAEQAVGAVAATGGGGGLGAGALLGGLAVVGGGIAVASGGDNDDESSSPPPPAPPADTTPPAAATGLAVNAAGTQITGQAEAGATVRIDTNGDGNPDVTTTAGADGRFSASLNPPLVDGQTLSITVRDAAGNTSAAATVIAPDTTPPPAATQVAVSSDGATITGVATAGATVRIDTNGDGTPDYTATARPDGTFSVAASPPLLNGQTVSVTVADAAGNVSAPATTVAPDTTPPPAATQIAVSSDGATITGIATAGATVRIDTNGDGTPDYTATARPDGTFSVSANPPLLDGQTVSVTVADAAGNVSASATTIAPDTTPPPAAIQVAVSSDGATITGVATAGATVRIDTNGDGTPDYTATARPDGTFSVSATPPLLNGQTVSVTVADAAGNVSAPATGNAPDTTAPNAATDVEISADGRILAGTAEAGATVQIDTNGDGTPDYTATVGQDGRFSVQLMPALIDGETASVTVQDRAGNASAPVSATAPDLDPTPPAPTIDPTDGTMVSGTSLPGVAILLYAENGLLIGRAQADADGNWSFAPGARLRNAARIRAVAVNSEGEASASAIADVDSVPPVAPDILTSNGTRIAGTAEAGSTVTVSVGGTVIGSVIVDADGAWSIPTPGGIANGALATVIAVDAAGGASPPASAIIDNAPPAAPIVAPTNGGIITGSAEIGSTITVTGPGGAVLGSVLVGDSGTWAIVPNQAPAGGTTITITATDVAGNESAGTIATIDATPPAAPVIQPSDGDSISGTAEPGSVVTLTLPGAAGGTIIAQIQADANGNWSFDPAGSLADGTVVQAVATDAAGNSSSIAAVIIDGAAPTAPIVQPTNGATISGTGEIGATIIVTGPNGPVGTAIVDANGNWTVQPTSAPADGTNLSITARDASGNISSPATIVVDADPPAQPILAPTNGNVIVGVVFSSGGAPEADALISISAGGQQLGTVRTDAQGNFSFNPTSPLPNGTLVTAVAQDASGNQSLAGSIATDSSLPSIPDVDASNGTAIGGQADPNITVIIVDGAGVEIARTTASASGSWNYTFPVPLGDGVTLRAIAENGTGTQSAAATIVTDAVAPAAPVIDPSNGVTLTGTAEAGTTVLLLRNGSGGPAIGAATVDADGRWSFTPGTALPDGTIIVAQARDDAGNLSIQTQGLIDALAPAAPVFAVSNGAFVTGTAEANSTIIVTRADGTPIGTAIADPSGNWSLVLTPALANGVILNATARDAAGNVGPAASVTIDAVAPAVPTAAPSNGMGFTGTGEPGATITISQGGVPIGSATVDANGNWSFTPTSPLADGTAVQVRAVDPAGNISGAANLVIDAISPPIPVIVPTMGVILSGTAEPGVTVVLRDGGGAAIGQVTADGNGNWSLTPTAPLANGTVVVAFAVDAAGNSSSNATTIVDTVAPGIPVIEPSNGAAISGTGEVGAIITVRLPDGTVIGTPQVQQDGSWSIIVDQHLADGTIISATAADAAGNVSGQALVTVDAVAPNMPTVGLSDGTVLSGRSDADVIIILQEGGGVIGTATPDANGNWTFTPATPLVNGSVVTVVARDPSGNLSAPADVAIDSIAPAAPVVQPSNGTALNGTAEAGATIILTDGAGNPIGVTSADANGAWTFTPGSQLPNATIVNVAARDAAGNISAATTITVDAVAPAVPTIVPSHGVLLIGTAEAGATVTLTDGAGNPIGTTVANVNGEWSLVPPTPLANGTVVSAIASDSVGNSSVAATITVDSVAPAAPVIVPSNGGVISGTAEAGAAITLTDTLGNAIGNTLADGNGNWSVTPANALADGTVVLAVATDPSGNASIAGAVTIDAVPPATPVVDPSNGLRLTGTAEADAILTLTNPNGAVIGTAIADANGAWSFVPGTQLANALVVNIVARDGAGNVSAAATVTIDGVAPAAPAIGPTNGTHLVGTAEAGARVTLSVAGSEIATVTADANGNWTFVPGSPLSGGVVVTATATDSSGNVSGPGTVTIDTTSPSNPVIDPSNGTIVTGRADAGDVLTLTANGVVIGTVIVGAGGTWSVTPPTPLPDGSTLIAVARNPAGTDSAPVNALVDAVAPGAPTIDVSTATTIAGTAEAGSTVTLVVGATLVGSVVADANGNWSFSPAPSFSNGAVVTIAARDAAGNVSIPSTVTIDALAPNAPILNPSSGGLLTGSAEAGALVVISAGNVVIGSVVADANGSWTLTPVPALGNGIVIGATATDGSGNVSAAATLTIDALAPNAATGLQVAADGSALTGVAEAGAQVRVVVEGNSGNPLITTVGAGGTFVLPFAPPLTEGQNLSVTIVDAAGNVSPPSLVEAPDLSPLVLTVAEAADGYVNGVEMGNGIQVSLGLTAGTDAGDTITVRFSGQNGYVADYAHVVTAAERATGVVALTLTPPQGMATFPQGAATISATSDGGPVSNAVGFTIDTVNPATPVLSLVGNILTIAGEPNSELTVQVNVGGAVATAVVMADNSGLASLNLLTDLNIGLSWNQLLNTSVSVRGEDAAGNVSNVATIGINPADQLVTIGNFGLDVALLPPRLGFSGQTEAGSSVRVEVVTPALTAIVAPAVDADGHFAVNLLSPQVLSQLGLTVTGLLNLGAGIGLNLVSTDAQGNESGRYGLTLAGSGLSLNIGQISITGDGDADILGGRTGVSEIINGFGGDDLILNVGTGDRVDTGIGNDGIELHATNFTSVNGGDGFDTIILADGIDIDYNGPGVGSWANIERVDLGTGDSGSVLTLTASEVDAVTDADNVLQITGEANDRLIITGATDTGATTTVDGLAYHVYSFGNTTVLVEDNSVTVVV